MAKVEMVFGLDDQPFSFKIDGQEIGDLITAVNINIDGDAPEPTILLRLNPVSIEMTGTVDTLEQDTGAFL